jgi:hypothetical protein
LGFDRIHAFSIKAPSPIAEFVVAKFEYELPVRWLLSPIGELVDRGTDGIVAF